MDPNLESELERQLIDRIERYGSGGVGVGMAVDTAPRRPWTRRAVLVTLPLLLCAAGFAGGRLWDGRQLDRLTFEQAIRQMTEAPDQTRRRSAMVQVYYFARKGLDAIVEHRDDPDLTDHAAIMLQQIDRALQTGQ